MAALQPALPCVLNTYDVQHLGGLCDDCRILLKAVRQQDLCGSYRRADLLPQSSCMRSLTEEERRSVHDCLHEAPCHLQQDSIESGVSLAERPSG